MIRYLVKYYLIRPQFKVLLLWVGVLGFSLIRIFYQPPENFLSSSGNLLNQIFAKWTWGWTLTFLTPYALLTSFVYSCDHWKRGLAFTGLRLLLMTGIWYFWAVIVFQYVENLTGVCFDSTRRPLLNIVDKRSCMKLEGKHRWDSFDISGHAFLLSFASLVIASELQVHRYWHGIPNHAARYIPIGSKSLIRLKMRHKSLENVTKWLFVLNCGFSLLWECILISTCLYYHDFFSKALGAGIGIMSWLVAYSELFPSKRLQLFPGHGPLQYLLTDIPERETQNGTKNDKKNH